MLHQTPFTEVKYIRSARVLALVVVWPTAMPSHEAELLLPKVGCHERGQYQKLPLTRARYFVIITDKNGAFLVVCTLGGIASGSFR